MIKEQTFEGRRENQASTLSRTCATLEALNHHRGKGQRKVTVEHAMYTPAGRLSSARSGPRGEGISRNQRDQPHAKQITHAPEARDVARGREAGACAGRERCLTGVATSRRCDGLFEKQGLVIKTCYLNRSPCLSCQGFIQNLYCQGNHAILETCLRDFSDEPVCNLQVVSVLHQHVIISLDSNVR